jgi:hypothetical protein
MVGLLWKSDQPITEASTYTEHKRQTSMPSAGFEPAIPANQAAEDLQLRTRGYWDQPKEDITEAKTSYAHGLTSWVTADIFSLFCNYFKLQFKAKVP